MDSDLASALAGRMRTALADPEVLLAQAGLDGGRCPVAFLTGAYDYSAPPDDARKLASSIAGSTVQLIARAGPFPHG